MNFGSSSQEADASAGSQIAQIQGNNNTTNITLQINNIAGTIVSECFPKLTFKAQLSFMNRLNVAQEALSKKMIASGIGDVVNISNPLLELVCRNFLNNYAITGENETLNMLIDIVIKRLSVNERSTEAIAMEVAIEKSRYITISHIKLLYIFLLIYQINYSLCIGVVESLDRYIDKNIKDSDVDYNDMLHLASLGMISYERSNERNTLVESLWPDFENYMKYNEDRKKIMDKLASECAFNRLNSKWVKLNIGKLILLPPGRVLAMSNMNAVNTPWA